MVIIVGNIKFSRFHGFRVLYLIEYYAWKKIVSILKNAPFLVKVVNRSYIDAMRIHYIPSINLLFCGY